MEKDDNDWRDLNRINRSKKDKTIEESFKLFTWYKVPYKGEYLDPLVKLDYTTNIYTFSTVSFKLHIRDKWISKSKYIISAVDKIPSTYKGMTLKEILETTDLFLNPRLFLYLNENYIVQ